MRTIFRTTQIISLCLIGVFFIRTFFIQYACSKIEHTSDWKDRNGGQFGNCLFSDYGSGPVQHNTASQVASWKDYYLLGNAIVPLSAGDDPSKYISIEKRMAVFDETMKNLDKQGMYLVIRKDPYDKQGCPVWSAIQKSDVESGDIIMNAFTLTSLNTVFNEHECSDNDLLSTGVIQFLGLALLLLLINWYSTLAIKNYDSYSKDYLGFRPKWLHSTNLGVRRIFSLLTNIVMLIGVFSILIYPIDCYEKLFVNKDLWDYNRGEETWSGIFFGVTAIYLLLYGILGLFFWVFKGFKQ